MSAVHRQGQSGREAGAPSLLSHEAIMSMLSGEGEIPETSPQLSRIMMLSEADARWRRLQEEGRLAKVRYREQKIKENILTIIGLILIVSEVIVAALPLISLLRELISWLFPAPVWPGLGINPEVFQVDRPSDFFIKLLLSAIVPAVMMEVMRLTDTATEKVRQKMLRRENVDSKRKSQNR